MLNGSLSMDIDGSIVTYAWVRTSGPNTPTIVSSSAASTSVTGLVEGTYVFTLTVTDDLGATNSDAVTVSVIPSAIRQTKSNISVKRK
jgi:hypothetical protein